VEGRSRTSLHAIALLLVAGLFAAACGSDDDGSDATASETQSTSAPSEAANGDDADPLAPQPLAERASIKIGLAGYFEANLPYVLAQELGEFEKENIEAEITVVPTTEAALLLSRSDLDLVPGSLSPGYLNVLHQGSNIKAVLPMQEHQPDGDVQQGLWVRKDVEGSDGFQGSDLEDKRVATILGAGASTLVGLYEEVLKPEGVDPKDIRWERLEAPDMPNALINGAVDAAWVHTPFWPSLVGDDCCDFVGTWPKYPTYVFFGPTLLDADPEVGAAVLRAIARTEDTYLQGEYNKNPDVTKIMVDQFQIPADSLENHINLYWNPDLEMYPDSIEILQEYYFAADAGLEYEEDDALTVDDVYDTSWRDALAGAD
jgi:NitT/TauT family transport system substrate-binding protein